MKKIDARGKACPLPVILAKKELDAGEKELAVIVDNAIAVENLTRLACSMGFAVSDGPAEGGFEVVLSKDGQTPEAEQKQGAQPVYAACAPGGYAVFIGKEYVGNGDETLGGNLMKMLLYTLSQSDDIPESLLFMNGGVKLPAGEEEQVIESIRTLSGRGCEVLVCGTCLNFYGLTERLKAGTVSNMYDILERMQKASKVITV